QAVTSREAKKKDDGVPRGSETRPASSGEPAVDTSAPAPTAGGKPKPSKVVFVMKDGKAEMRVVHTGIASRTDVEILDGLNEGETIIDGPYRTLARELQDGQSVKEMSKDGPGDKAGPHGDHT